MAAKERLRLQRFPMLRRSKGLWMIPPLIVTIVWMGYLQSNTAVTYDRSKPILLLGLPKSGSEAIHQFLECMGVASRHYCCDDDTTKSTFPCRQQTCGACIHANLQTKKPPFAGCVHLSTTPIIYAQFDVESDEPFSWFLPQRFALPLLQDHSGLWILNTRGDSTEWASHILHWHSITRRLFRAFDLPYYADRSMQTARTVVAPTKELSVEFLQQQLDQSLIRAKNVTEHQRRKTLLTETYEQHSSFVRQYANRNRRTLLEINVDSTPDEISLALAKAFRLDPKQARQCWRFDPVQYGDDWRDFELKV